MLTAMISSPRWTAKSTVDSLRLPMLQNFPVAPPATSPNRPPSSSTSTRPPPASTPPSARARRQIDLLREYRTRLIADVVTGKLDVRETAASLPEGPGQ